MRDCKALALGELATLTMGQSPPFDSINSDERGLPFLQGCAEFGLVSPEAKVYCSPVLRLAHAGATLISVRAPVGTMNLADQDYGIGRGLAAVLAKAGVADNTFLRHAIAHGSAYLYRRSQGSTFLAISSDDLRSMPIPAFCQPSQKRIAEILSTLDEAIEQTEALIAKTQAIKTGLMHDLLTRGVTANGELRPPREEAPQLYKASPLGSIPNDWAIRPLRELASVDRGKFSIRPRNDPRYYDGEFPFIQTGDVALAAGGELSAYTQTLNANGLAVSRLFPAGTIMVTIAANIGDTCTLAVPMCAPDSLVGVVPNEDEVGRFLQMCIQNQKRSLENRAPQTAQRNINLDDLRPLPIPYPDHDEQLRIAAQYDAVSMTLNGEAAHLAELLQYKQGLMHDLLTGRVPVPLPESEALAADA